MDFVADIASVGRSKTEEELQEEELEDKDREIQSLKNELEHEKSVKYLNSLRKEWELNTLRKTTLKPNYAIRGKVYFPINSSLEYLHIYFPLEDSELEFNYKQQEFK